MAVFILWVIGSGVSWAQPIDPWLADGLNRQIQRNKEAAAAAPVYRPPSYSYYGALAMDEYGMAYGGWIASAGLLSNQLSTKPKAIAECEAAKPFGKCSIVATVSGGALALAWNSQNGHSAWATAQELDEAKQAALRQCGSPGCTIAYWQVVPQNTSSRQEGEGSHGWLPGDNAQLVSAMLQRQNVRLHETQIVLDRFAFISTSKDFINPKDAERVMMDSCHAAGLSTCRVAHTYADTCGAVAFAKVKGQPQYFTATDPEPRRAEDTALQQCADQLGTRHCFVYTAQCAGLAYGNRPSHPLTGAWKVNEKDKSLLATSAAEAQKDWQGRPEVAPATR
ncbi:MAG: DUF4189 domain-containing protein [Pseudomonadota bacterium]|nr:DUF4189 domain-containing protein [Pseudomonadota bacterium]